MCTLAGVPCPQLPRGFEGCSLLVDFQGRPPVIIRVLRDTSVPVETRVTLVPLELQAPSMKRLVLRVTQATSLTLQVTQGKTEDPL